MAVVAPARNALARRWFRGVWKLGQNALGRNTGGRWHGNAGAVLYAAPPCTAHGPNARSICIRPGGGKREMVGDFACIYLAALRIWGRTHFSRLFDESNRWSHRTHASWLGCRFSTGKCD